MGKVRIRISKQITVDAFVDIDVEEKVAGTYSSPEDRGKALILSLLAAGLPVAWQHAAPTPDLHDQYKFDAVRVDQHEAAPTSLNEPVDEPVIF